jgi:ribosome biogenesis GTPase
MTLSDLGFSDFFAQQLDDPSPGSVPARVVRLAPHECQLCTPDGDLVAHVPTRVADARTPVVGDWVLVDLRADPPVIQRVLDRRTSVVRKSAGRRTQAQSIAVNVDVVFVVTGLDGDFNLRRIERYLALVFDSGARPVVLLTKAGLCADVEERRLAAESVAPGVDVHAIDVLAGIGADVPGRYLGAGVTAALVGSSGAGKSTLLNHLVGERRMDTGAVRRGDDRGRHTTTHRELFWLPEGGAIIDNPGMRELGLWLENDGLAHAFSDIEEIASGCRFGDCTHRHEPGCAVVAAVEDGELAPERLEGFLDLQAEAESSERRRDAAERRAHERRGSKVIRQVMRMKKNRR